MVTDPGVLDQLHRDHANALWAYVVRLTGDRTFAQDVVQETMLRAWREGITDQTDTNATSAGAAGSYGRKGWLRLLLSLRYADRGVYHAIGITLWG